MRFFVRTIAVSAGLFALFQLLTFAIVRLQMETFHRTVVGPAPPEALPILVVDSNGSGLPTDARIVFHRELVDVPPTNGSRTFEAEAGMERTINDLITAGCRRKTTANPSIDASPRRPGTVRRETGSLGSIMRVEDKSDSDIVQVGWYRTEGPTIVALSYQNYFGPGLVLSSMAISAAIAIVTLVLGAGAIAIHRAQLRRAATAPR
jgi:hypothetical protein